MSVGLNLIVAACEKGGIGFKGNLPWKLKNEMAYFTKMTSDVKDKNKKNAVIMGRKTWDSIPPKFKPLAKRLNIVLSQTIVQSDVGEKAVVCKSLEDAVKMLAEVPYKNDVENVWVIGGSAIYQEAMKSPHCHRLYYTKIMKEFECDTFLPPIPDNFTSVRDDRVPEGMQSENGINYEFTVLERVK